ncbi:aspartate carbamoyltransferase regulatory subunit [Streptobacillus felis]|uniref:Aspartate carbamoyltransferase regulatory subunit n=1 Tax=Streptobacillus felis TaxID=1384509 RepID=A0A7Z0PFI9_9FUSO|nr:aspartate carbamoyltransferase regulatory subunit [Streptobacillus felis]NYV27632.1 aspartate carbamoyltransferase regulatory subunit [Streptobacillus felis]
MLNINSISKGIVIDHIKTGLGYEIFKLLELDKAKFRVALIMNAESKKNGKKDMIKIENNIDIDFSILGLIDPNVTVNIIENENIKEKIKIKLPEKVEEYIKCKNPRCITMHENIKNEFTLVDEKEGTYKCHYCDHFQTVGGK